MICLEHSHVGAQNNSSRETVGAEFPALSTKSKALDSMTVKILSDSDPRVQQHIGKKFNLLTAVRFLGMKNGYQVWEFKCDCGRTTVTTMKRVISGNTTSCGCVHRAALIASRTIHGHAARGREHPLYRVWKRMRQRCFDKGASDFEHYGGRGISIRWDSYQHFFEDMNSTYKRGLTIDRTDNDGNYQPDNCSWETRKTQALNRRSAHMVTFNGETLNLCTWSERLGIKFDTLRRRLKLGWTVERAFTAPVRQLTRRE